MKLTDKEVNFICLWERNNPVHGGVLDNMWNRHPSSDPHEVYQEIMDRDDPAVHAALAALTAAKLLGEV